MRKQRIKAAVKQVVLTLLGWALRDTAFEFILDLLDGNSFGQ